MAEGMKETAMSMGYRPGRGVYIRRRSAGRYCVFDAANGHAWIGSIWRDEDAPAGTGPAWQCEHDGNYGAICGSLADAKAEFGL